jgi:hypothetical protein
MTRTLIAATIALMLAGCAQKGPGTNGPIIKPINSVWTLASIVSGSPTLSSMDLTPMTIARPLNVYVTLMSGSLCLLTATITSGGGSQVGGFHLSSVTNAGDCNALALDATYSVDAAANALTMCINSGCVLYK